ncbi:MAG: YggT family protein [Spirochaetaceae bacterium]|nr:YggT family protein [Spirochaetaceae bacterium]
MNTPTVLQDLARLLASVLRIYSILIWIRIIFSWIKMPNQQYKQEGALMLFIGKIVDPFLNLFSGVKGLKSNSIDFSPLLAFALLSIVTSLLQIYGVQGYLTLGITLGLIAQTFYSFIISPFFFIFILLLGVRLFFCFKRTPTTIVMARGIESIVGGLMNWVQKVFFGSKGVANRTLVIVTLVFTIILYVIFRMGFIYIISILAKL